MTPRPVTCASGINLDGGVFPPSGQEQILDVFGVPVATHEEHAAKSILGGEPREDLLIQHPAVAGTMPWLEAQKTAAPTQPRIEQDGRALMSLTPREGG